VRDQKRHEIADAVLKVIGVAVAVGMVVALGAFVMVKALGFSDSTPSAHSTAAADPSSPSALPTVALSSPGATVSGPDPAQTGTPSPSTGPKRKKSIRMSATPVLVKPMERINITGTWHGHDNVALQVQRKENGIWTDFAGVQAPVQVGTFTTYVLTSRAGDNKFRVVDPASGKASNAVTVTVG
jgi:hypothetical protein